MSLPHDKLMMSLPPCQPLAPLDCIPPPHPATIAGSMRHRGCRRTGWLSTRNVQVLVWKLEAWPASSEELLRAQAQDGRAGQGRRLPPPAGSLRPDGCRQTEAGVREMQGWWDLRRTCRRSPCDVQGSSSLLFHKITQQRSIAQLVVLWIKQRISTVYRGSLSMNT